MNVFFKISVAAIVLLTACKKDKETTKAPADNIVSQAPLVTGVSNTKMVYIEGGKYKPFFGSDTAVTDVLPFMLDETSVTNEQYLQFVTANPQWRKSEIKRLFADSNYLHDWPNDIELPKGSNKNSPITSISWFAARAFAHSVGKRLPTLDEWEFVAMADNKVPNARTKKQYSADIIDLYLQKDRQYHAVKQSGPNYYGVYNMFDLVWEWTNDFNSVLTTGDTRNDNEDKKGLFCGGGAASATDLLNYAAFMRFGLRTSLLANYTVANLGFRCAKDTNTNIMK